MTEWWKSLNVQTQISVIVVLVSIVSLIINTFVNLLMKKKDIKANIVSKARIEWISEVRILIAEFIKKVQKLNKSIDYSKVYTGDELERITRETGEDIIELNYTLAIITLYFSDNKENNKVIKNLHNVYSAISAYYTAVLMTEDKQKSISKEKIAKAELDECIEECLLICRNYLKNEWEKAKKGK